MKLIVGLGNPGKKYEDTRHNLGFMVVDELASRLQRLASSWEHEEKFRAEILKIELNNEKIIFAKPLTYMNNSGMAVRLISQYFNIPISDVWIVHDDVDLPLGSIKIRFGGASAGHKGMKSIIENLGTDKFWRFRIGIGRPKIVQNSKFKIQNLDNEDDIREETVRYKSYIKGVENFVLSKFDKEESGRVKEVIRRGVKAIETALDKGMTIAMNKYNTR